MNELKQQLAEAKYQYEIEFTDKTATLPKIFKTLIDLADSMLKLHEGQQTICGPTDDELKRQIGLSVQGIDDIFGQKVTAGEGVKAHDTETRIDQALLDQITKPLDVIKEHAPSHGQIPKAFVMANIDLSLQAVKQLHDQYWDKFPKLKEHVQGNMSDCPACDWPVSYGVDYAVGPDRTVEHVVDQEHLEGCPNKYRLTGQQESFCTCRTSFTVSPATGKESGCPACDAGLDMPHICPNNNNHKGRRSAQADEACPLDQDAPESILDSKNPTPEVSLKSSEVVSHRQDDKHNHASGKSPLKDSRNAVIQSLFDAGKIFMSALSATRRYEQELKQLQHVLEKHCSNIPTGKETSYTEDVAAQLHNALRHLKAVDRHIKGTMTESFNYAQASVRLALEYMGQEWRTDSADNS